MSKQSPNQNNSNKNNILTNNKTNQESPGTEANRVISPKCFTVLLELHASKTLSPYRLA